MKYKALSCLQVIVSGVPGLLHLLIVYLAVLSLNVVEFEIFTVVNEESTYFLLGCDGT
jgi:hypothetical protein